MSREYGKPSLEHRPKPLLTPQPAVSSAITHPLDPTQLIQLQRLIGNQAVQRLIRQQALPGHLHKAPAAAPPAGSVWAGLDEEARQLLNKSYEVLHVEDDKEFWIWNKTSVHLSAKSCFNAVDQAKQTAFRDVFNALKQQNLTTYLDHVVDFWPSKTRGIKFMPSSRSSLIKALNSGGFCRDKYFAAVPKWRQMVKTGTEGLHILVPANGWCSAHLDRLSPVEYREENGQCNYAAFTSVHHWLKEEEHFWDKILNWLMR